MTTYIRTHGVVSPEALTLLDEAADEIERLRAENAELRRQIEAEAPGADT